jgi:hypothetical protein
MSGPILECGQLAGQRDDRFDTFHDVQYPAISWRASRFKGNCILKIQRDSIIADDSLGMVPKRSSAVTTMMVQTVSL